MRARLLATVVAILFLAPAAAAEHAPSTVPAYFTSRSYGPGKTARLLIEGRTQSIRGVVFQAGPETRATWAPGTMNGVRVPDARLRLGPHGGTLTIGYWKSGLYFVRLTGPDGRVGYAPFVVRARPLGTSRVAVVLPTNTWQAYNFRDDDGDGVGNSWYAAPSVHTVELARPFADRGVPPHFANYDQGFVRWLAHTDKSADFLSDDDLERMSGDRLAALYDLIVFPGHEEYVTPHEYDAIELYRNRGGNLMFLSANNFFWKVDKTGQVLQKIGKWRDVGRPEASLIGVQYRANDDGQRQGLFTVQSASTAPWLWAGTGLGDGSTFGQYVGGYGIEIDATAPSSPPGTLVLAQIADLFGPGITAQMSYYETASGAKVFAAGTLDFGGSATFWPVKQILDNLWARLSQP